MSNPICFALDGMNGAGASRYVEMLEEHVGAFKVGLELFIRTGKLPKTSKPVILDLKLHDIPETVSRAVAAGCDAGAKFMTLHVQQREALKQAVAVAAPYGCTLLGVTVLTSMTQQDCEDLRFKGFNTNPESPGEPRTSHPFIGMRVQHLADFGYGCGLRGFVCSPQEVGSLHTKHPDAFYLVPGVRPLGSAVGDQRRTGTPGGAVIDGASLIVIGRPIRDAEDPVEAAKAILAEVREAERTEENARAGARALDRHC